jgi:hypothetical protein
MLEPGQNLGKYTLRFKKNKKNKEILKVFFWSADLYRKGHACLGPNFVFSQYKLDGY